jgi:carbon storage regulator
MLTLTRRPGQRIRIGDGIVIVVKDVKGKQVRLGIEAPPGVPIYREEIFQEIVKEMGAAASIAEDELIDAILGPTGSSEQAVITSPQPSVRPSVSARKDELHSGSDSSGGKEEGDED